MVDIYGQGWSWADLTGAPLLYGITLSTAGQGWQSTFLSSSRGMNGCDVAVYGFFQPEETKPFLVVWDGICC